MTTRKTTTTRRRKSSPAPVDPPEQVQAEPQSEPVAAAPSPYQQWQEQQEPQPYRPTMEEYHRWLQSNGYAAGDDEGDEYEDEPRSLSGCLIAVAVVVFLLLSVAVAVLLYRDFKRSNTPPQPAPVVTPVSGDLSALLAPLRSKLASDRAKAAVVADAYTGLADALRGPSGKRITNTRIYETVSRGFLTDVDARGGVAVGGDIDAAIAAWIGSSRSTDPKDPGYEAVTIDDSKRARLIEVVAAIARTAEELR